MLPGPIRARPVFWDRRYRCFKPEGVGLDDMKLTGMTIDRLGDRKALLTSFDRMRREVDARGGMQAADMFTQQAFNVLSSSRLLEALDISKEDPAVLARYGDGKPYKFQYDGAPDGQRTVVGRPPAGRGRASAA